MEISYKMFVETDVPKDELIISRTDLKGTITYANEMFGKISGYSVEELVGKPHNIVRHPDMPRSIFKEIWETLKSDEIWSGYVKNLRRDKGYYWVYAQISGVYKEGTLIEYKSMRSPMSDNEKIIYQERYDNQRKSEEGTCRVVATLSAKNLEKLSNFAKEEGINEDTLLDRMLEDNLL